MATSTITRKDMALQVSTKFVPAYIQSILEISCSLAEINFNWYWKLSMQRLPIDLVSLIRTQFVVIEWKAKLVASLALN